MCVLPFTKNIYTPLTPTLSPLFVFAALDLHRAHRLCAVAGRARGTRVYGGRAQLPGPRGDFAYCFIFLNEMLLSVYRVP